MTAGDGLTGLTLKAARDGLRSMSALARGVHGCAPARAKNAARPVRQLSAWTPHSPPTCPMP